MLERYKKFFLVLILLIAAFLRLWKVNIIPVSLFGDELDVGYQAYSILKTGKDYYGNFMPLHFHSLAEWRTPLYLYSAVPTVAVFGISPLGVRLPAVLFGILGIWGIYLLVKEMTKDSSLSILSAFFLAISPWHIQYSRAGFEVTMLLGFLVFGLYFFFKSLQESKYLWVSVALLTFTPWIYSTAKLFTPLLILFLLVTWKKEILRLGKSDLFKSIVVGFIVGLPIVYSTIFGGGAQRAGYTSVFTDPTVVPEIGNARMQDNLIRGDLVLGYEPNFWDRFYHNKITFWTERVIKNYLESFSFNFLFDNGDPNLRHSIKGMGQFYKIEVLTLILGVVLFFTSKSSKKIKSMILFWLLIGALPAALTRDGGTHATRLIIILPPLIFLIAFGFWETPKILAKNKSNILMNLYFFLLLINFLFYQHAYWVHNQWDSERWWHSGFEEAISTIKKVDKDYEKVIISNAGEPTWIFFAGWYEYPPDKWQKEFPIGNDVFIDGFGLVSHTDKYYFGTFNIEGASLYDLDKYIDGKTLYMAVAKEIGANLIMEPERTPGGLKLVKAIPFPSGEPAYYLFAKN